MLGLAVNCFLLRETRNDQYKNITRLIRALYLTDPPLDVLAEQTSALLGYLGSFLETTDPVMNHLALWTLVQLLKGEVIYLEKYEMLSL